MYPYPVVLIGSPEGLPDLDASLTGCAAKLVGRYPDVRAMRVGREGATDAAVFLVRLRHEEDLQHLRLLSDAFPGQPIVGLVEGGADELALYRLNRAGAAQLVPVPWAAGDLTAALDRVARQFGRVPPLARVIAVCGVVGGAGATTLVVNLGFELAVRWGKQCILAEPAAPVGQLTAYLNIGTPRPTKELYHAATPPNLTSVQNALTAVTKQVMLLAAPPPTFPAPPMVVGRADAVVEACRQLADVVLLDVPYTFDETCVGLLSRSDEVLLVSDTSIPALQTLKFVKDALTQRRGVGPVRVVVNRYGAKGDPDPSRLCEALAVPEVWTVAEDHRGFLAAMNAGTPLRADAQSSPALADFDRLARALFGLPTVVDPPRSAFTRPRGGS